MTAGPVRQNRPKSERAAQTGGPKSLREAEAPGGFEPPHRGFADLCLTTWLRRRAEAEPIRSVGHQQPFRGLAALVPAVLVGEFGEGREPVAQAGLLRWPRIGLGSVVASKRPRGDVSLGDRKVGRPGPF